MLKSDGSRFLWKVLGKKSPKIGYFAFFENFNKNKSFFNSCLSIANFMLCKILVLELLHKMLLANQIAGSFKVMCKKMRDQVDFCLR